RAGAGRSDRAVGRVDRIAGATGGGFVRRLSEGCGRELFAAAGRAVRHGAGRAGVLSVVRADAGAHGPGVGLGIGGPAGVGGRVAGDGAGSKGGAGGGAADVGDEFGHDAFVRDQRIAHRCDRGGDRVAAVVGAVAGMAAILRGHGFAVAVCRYHGGAAVGGAGVHHGVFCARGVALAGAGQRAGGVGGGGVDRAHHRAGAIVLGELSVVLRDRGVAVDVEPAVGGRVAGTLGVVRKPAGGGVVAVASRGARGLALGDHAGVHGRGGVVGGDFGRGGVFRGVHAGGVCGEPGVDTRGVGDAFGGDGRDAHGAGGRGLAGGDVHARGGAFGVVDAGLAGAGGAGAGHVFPGDAGAS